MRVSVPKLAAQTSHLDPAAVDEEGACVLRPLSSVPSSKAQLPVMRATDESQAQFKLQLEGSILQWSSEVPQAPEQREASLSSPHPHFGSVECVCVFLSRS